MKMSEEARLARNEYMRKWKAKNKDKVKKWNAAYWKRKQDLKKQEIKE